MTTLVSGALHDSPTMTAFAVTCATAILAYCWAQPALNDQKRALNNIPIPKGYPYIGKQLVVRFFQALKWTFWYRSPFEFQ